MCNGLQDNVGKSSSPSRPSTSYTSVSHSSFAVPFLTLLHKQPSSCIMNQAPYQTPSRASSQWHTAYAPLPWLFWVRIAQLALTVITLILFAYSASQLYVRARVVHGWNWTLILFRSRSPSSSSWYDNQNLRLDEADFQLTKSRSHGLSSTYLLSSGCSRASRSTPCPMSSQ